MSRHLTPAQAWSVLQAGNARFVTGEMRAPVPERRPAGRGGPGADPVRGDLRLRRLPGGRGDHLRPGARRPVRRPHRRARARHDGRRVDRVRRRPALRRRSSSSSRTTAAARSRAATSALTTGELPRGFVRAVVDRVIPSIVGLKDHGPAGLASLDAETLGPRAHPAHRADAAELLGGAGRGRGRRPLRDRRASSTRWRTAASRSSSPSATSARRRSRSSRPGSRPPGTVPCGSGALPRRLDFRPTGGPRHDERHERRRRDPVPRRPRVPHRARHDGRGPRTRPGPVPRPDAACRRELPDLRDAARARPHRGARADQEGRRAGQRRARRPRGRRRGGHRRGRGRGRGRCARRPLPDRHLPDRLRDVVEHEHQRGARDPGDPPPGPAGAPQRPRQRLAVVQRRVPDVGPPRRDVRRRARARPGARAPRGGAGGEGRRSSPAS